MTNKDVNYEQVNEVLRTVICGFSKKTSKEFYNFALLLIYKVILFSKINRKPKHCDYPDKETHLLRCQDNNWICELYMKQKTHSAYVIGIL